MQILSVVILRAVETLISITFVVSLFGSIYASMLLSDKTDQTNYVGAAILSAYVIAVFAIGFIAFIPYLVFCYAARKKTSKILWTIFILSGMFMPIWLFFFYFGV